MEIKQKKDPAVLLAIARSKKARISRSRLEAYAETVAELRQKGESYAEIANFLHEHADIDCSRQMVHKFVAMMTAKADHIYAPKPTSASPPMQALAESTERPNSIIPVPSHITSETGQIMNKVFETPEKLEPLDIMTKEKALRYRQERLGSA